MDGLCGSGSSTRTRRMRGEKMCIGFYEGEGEGGEVGTEVGTERCSMGYPVLRLLSLLRLLLLLHLFLSSHLLRLRRQQRLELRKEERKGCRCHVCCVCCGSSTHTKCSSVSLCAQANFFS
jgi:hypothetical protein